MGLGGSSADESGKGLDAWERRWWRKGTSVAGVDEAGRGPLAGPVVAAAFSVLAPEDEEVLDLLSRVNDSKQLTEQQRESLYEELTDAKFQGRTAWCIAECSVKEIDAGNILQASLQAMSRAVHGLTVRPGTVLVDGCNRPPELLGPGEKWTRESQRDLESRKNQTKLAKWFKKPKVEEAEPWRPKEVEAVIEGDGRVPSISAASVLAKVSRDRQMDRLDSLHPLYGFKAHKGYGTEAHLKAIRQHGICSEHRKTFGPIREAIEREKVKLSGEAVSDNKRSLTEDALQGSRKSRCLQHQDQTFAQLMGRLAKL
ncbi:rnhB [Symbiodinium sp. CCMP2456]|nr:rnhB [Symbiodinium sp. CCMP2456]